MSDDHGMVHEFVGEAKEHLANISDDLLALEQGKGGSPRYRVDRLFRSIHSVKGGAGFFGFLTVADLAHALEAVLEPFRLSAEPPGRDVLDALIAGTDLLASLFDDIERSNEADVSAARDRLVRMVPAPPPQPSPARGEGVSQDAAGGPAIAWPREVLTTALSMDELAPEFRAALDAGSDGFLYLLSCDLGEVHHSLGLTPVALGRVLRHSGEVVEARLELEASDLANGLPRGPLLYRALYASPLEPDALHRATGLSAAHLRPVERPAAPAPAVVEQVEMPRREERVSTVRINVDLLDRLMTVAGELVLVRNQALLAVDPDNLPLRRVVQRLNAVTAELQEAVLLTRMQPVSNLFNKFPRLVRDLARQLGKQIELTVAGGEVELDKTVLEALSDPLTHLVRNCCDHGIESPDDRADAGKATTGHVRLSARQEGGQIALVIADDGKGIDANALRRKVLQLGLRTPAEMAALSDHDVLPLILLPGLSTAREVTDLSGRGVGMDVVKTNLDRLGGSLDIESEAGRGTTFHLRLPLTVAIIPCLVVTADGERYALPQKDLEELVCLYPNRAKGTIEYAHDQEVYRLRDRLLPLVRLTEVLGRREPFAPATRGVIAAKHRGADRDGLVFFAVVKAGARRFGLVVDRILNTEEVVVKPMHATLTGLRCFAGATIMGDGRVALILDVEGVARHAGVSHEPLRAVALGEADETKALAEKHPVLLFRSGPSEQFAIPLAMVRRVTTVRADDLERVGDRAFVTADGTSTRVVRLDHYLQVSPLAEQDTYYLLLPRNVRRPVGVLLSAVLDTTALAADLTTDSYREDGVMGTAVIRDRMTLFLDVFRLMDRIDPETEREQRKEAPRIGRRPRVLVVDDTQFFRQLVQGYLECDGCEVTTAIHGEDALAALGNGDFDLVVSDIEMPVMNGWDFARAVRREAATAGLPLLALTTLNSDADRERATACGYDRYEVKIDRDRFLAAVADLLRGNRAEEGRP